MSEENLDVVSPEASSAIPAADTPAPERETPAAEPDKPKTLREQIVSAKDEVEADIKKRGNPYKAVDGKFTRKPLEPKAPETAAAAITESEPTTEAPQAPQAQAMPKSWSADKQELWTGLPQAAKDFILSRENQVNEGFAKYQGLEPKYKELDAVLAPLDPMIQGYGTTRPEFVKQLTQWHQALANNPHEAFPALARAYGYNLGSPAADPALQPNIVHDPRVEQIMPAIAQMQQWQVDQQRREQEAQMRQTSEHVAKWATEKPHYEKVRQQMGLLIKSAAESGKEMSLDEAYETATWATPEIREQLMKDRFNAEQKAAAEAAQKAKLASVSVASRSPTGASLNGSKSDGSIRGSIKAAIADARGAGRA